VWYFQCFGHLLEESDKYTVTYRHIASEQLSKPGIRIVDDHISRLHILRYELLALHASHFFTYRHVMHSMGLFWLGMVIILSRINLQEWIACLSFTVWMGVSSYGISYHEEYSTIPHRENTGTQDRKNTVSSPQPLPKEDCTDQCQYKKKFSHFGRIFHIENRYGNLLCVVAPLYCFLWHG